MKSSIRNSISCPHFPLAGVLFLLTMIMAQGAEQILNLADGWNAVWLEVNPSAAPEDVFSDPAVLTVVSPKPLAGLSEFFAADPGTITTFNQEEWEQWKSVDPSGSNNLVYVEGNRPYLIQTSSPVILSIPGDAIFFRPKWVPDRYNLIGFGLQGTPSFDAFFGPSGNKHRVDRIFRLNAATGIWQPVVGTETMVSGEAYWVFCSGPSDYMGPIAVDFDYAVTGEFNFGGPLDVLTVDTGDDALELDLEELIFTNLSNTDSAPRLELETKDPGSGSLDLHVVIPLPDSFEYERGNQVDSSEDKILPPAPLGEVVASQSTTVVTLGALRNWSSGQVARTNLYRLETGPDSASFWLPVTALNNDLQLPSDLIPETETGLVSGLWAGEVILTKVTSFVEDGSPVRPAAGSAPIRILLHSDSEGVVKLLSQVTIMQTRTADPEIDPVPVLVVDPSRIPYFEGIKQRAGKQVGLRIEAVAYDMPRRMDPESQEALIEDPQFLLLTGLSEDLQKALGKNPVLRTQEQTDLIEASSEEINAAKSAIPSLLPGYLISSSLRPPKLVEAYHFAWPMEGAIGSGKTVRTLVTQPLVLDPFHRSNPFRHAFHQSHVKGQNITREMRIIIDSDQYPGGRLVGTFSETIRGLAKSDLTLEGRVELQRLSPVANIEGTQ